MTASVRQGRSLAEVGLGDHLLMVNESEEMELRRYRQLMGLALDQGWRFFLMCDRNRVTLLEMALKAIDPEDLYYVPLDLNWRMMAGKCYDERYFVQDHYEYLKVAGYLDRPVVIFTSHSNALVTQPDHLERMMRVEAWRNFGWRAIHPQILACSYLESDENGSPLPLGRENLQRLLLHHTHYVGATKSDAPRPIRARAEATPGRTPAHA